MHKLDARVRRFCSTYRYEKVMTSIVEAAQEFHDASRSMRRNVQECFLFSDYIFMFTGAFVDSFERDLKPRRFVFHKIDRSKASSTQTSNLSEVIQAKSKGSGIWART